MGLVVGGRARCRPRPPLEIRDGVLDSVGARLCSVLPGRAPSFAAATGCGCPRSSDLLAEFLVELEQRVRQLSPYAGQCRAERAIVSPRSISRILGFAIRRIRTVVFRRPYMAGRDRARLGRTAGSPARRLCTADADDDD